MKITIDSIKKAALIVGEIFFFSLSIIKADDNIQSGLTPEMLRPDFSKLTPEAASLGRYGAFQVSEYSGAANISIPLYTVKSGDVSFPINLYYDATGIKVEQDATFVGLGWNLSYGGMISHIVCGKDDFLEEQGFPEFEQNWWKEKINEIKPKIPYDIPIYYRNYIEERLSTEWPFGIPNKLSNDDILKYFGWHADSDIDKEFKLYTKISKGYDIPDIYQACFCGHNISFTIDKRTGKVGGRYPIIILNDNPQKYKISYELESISYEGYPSSFTITDDNGITYCFNKACLENHFPNTIGLINKDSYYLTMIYGPDGENGKNVVRFEYEQINCSVNNRSATKNHRPTVKAIDSDRVNIPSDVYNAYNNFFKKISYETEVACGEGGHCEKVYPKKIITDLETIEFELGERLDIGAKCISGITIKSLNGDTLKETNFEYEYFFETPVKPSHDWFSHRRLKLIGVKIGDKKFKFEYNNQNLPSFASYSKDYWGYYNGANPDDNEFVGCTPAYSISNGMVKPIECLTGSNRLASEKLCNVGMLKKIIYPTGGYTLYEFEANRFNDKYYYPDANHKVLSSTASALCDNFSFYGTMSQTRKFKLSKQAIFKINISMQSLGSDDMVEIIVRDSQNTKVAGDTIKGPDKGISKVLSVTFAANEEYTIEVKSKTSKETSSSSCGDCIFYSEEEDALLTMSPTPTNENGGYSIGGGLRIKNIKNYNSDGTYLNGVKYEYSGGKLLRPTPQLETHYIDCSHNDDPNGIFFSFLYANTEPAYLYICSLGIPATIGYDTVVKKEIDENDEITYRKTVLEYHNCGYDSNSPAKDINSLTQSSFYYLPYSDGPLNGMIKRKSVFNGSAQISETKYKYESIKLDTIYYLKTIPLHIPGVKNAVENFERIFYRKYNTWTYLTSKTETLYDNNGEQTMSNTTQYEYNSSNYQLSQQTVSNGVDSIRTNYWYPTDTKVLSDKKVKNYQYLNDVHKISEITAIDTYRNGTFTGGSQFDFRKWTKTKLPVPVVDKCYSITPFNDKILEMKVDETYGYDNYGNIRQYNKKDGTPVTIIWSYNHQLPIMEIVGKTYSQVKAIYAKVADLEKDDISSTDITTKTTKLHEALKAEGTFATAYLYSPWHTVSEIIKPNGDKVKYSYDDYGRLKETKDVNNKILQKYSYNYKEKIK